MVLCAFVLGMLVRLEPAQIVQFDSAGFAPAITRLKDGLLASEGEVSAKKPFKVSKWMI